MNLTDSTTSRPTTSPFFRRGAALLAGATLLTSAGLSALAVPASASPAGAVAPAAAGTTVLDAVTTVAGKHSPALDRAARNVVAAGSPGFIAYVRDGKQVYTAAAGTADRRTGRPITADDQFEIGSNTKTFTSVVILQMVARGDLSLDDTVEKHLPGLVPGGDKITVRMLLNHTSGLFSYTGDQPFMDKIEKGDPKVWKPEEIVKVGLKHKPDFAPGKGWQYSNTNYILAGMIAEKVSGRSLASLIEHRIARPLGLKRTYLVTSTVKNQGRGFAHGYTITYKGDKPNYVDVASWPIGGWGGAAGAIVSTPSELAAFFSGLMSGRLLPAAQLAQMRTTVTLSKQYADATGATGYGLGLFRIETPKGTFWGHGGDTLGHHSSAVVSADGSRVAVTDTTAQTSPPKTPGQVAFATKQGAALAAGVAAAESLIGRPASAHKPAA